MGIQEPFKKRKLVIFLDPNDEIDREEVQNRLFGGSIKVKNP